MRLCTSMRRTLSALFLICLAAAPAATARAQDGLRLEPVAEGLEQPVLVTHAGDGSGRLFVVEQAGRIRILDGGRLLEEPFLDITDRVGSGGERGLLGLAFHPDYADNGRFFVNYTRRAGRRERDREFARLAATRTGRATSERRAAHGRRSRSPTTTAA